MIRVSTTFIVFMLLASVLITPSQGGTTDKAQILADLSASPEHVSSRIKSNSKDAGELAIDLIVYRWAVRQSKTLPTDVNGINEIIPALKSELNDHIINWTADLFSISQNSPNVAELPNDPRVAQLSELKRQYGMALDYRDSSPIKSVNALSKVLDICQNIQLDITEALIRTILGNKYHYDMARYMQAEDCYGRAASIFNAYHCYESNATLYNDYGALCSETSRYTGAVANYSQSSWLWAQLAKLNPNISRYKYMAGREYILTGQAQNAAGNPNKAIQFMNLGLEQLRAHALMTKSYGDLITNLIVVSNVYRDQNDLPKALELLKAADKACQLNSDLLLAAKVHQELYTAYKLINLPIWANKELSTRDDILNNAVIEGETSLAKLTSSDSLPKESQIKLETKAEQGAQALQQLKKNQESADLLQKMLEVYKRSSQIDEQIRCLRSIANVLDLQHKPQDSLNARLEAAKLAMKSNRKAIAADIARDMVQAFIDIGDLNNALETLTDLAPIFMQSGNVRSAADVLEGRGTLLASNGGYEDAIKNFQEALIDYSTIIGDPWAAGAVSLKLASAQNSLGKKADACATIEAGLKDIEARYVDENLDPNTNPDRSRLMMNLYKELIATYIRDGKIDFAQSSITKARRYQYQWVSELVNQLKKSDDSDVSSFAKNVDLIGGSDTSSIDSIRNKQTLLANNWADFSTKCAVLREQYPVVYNALPINPLEFYKQKNNLPKKSLVIEYLPTDYSTFVFVCGNGKSIIWELGASRKDLDAMAVALRKSIKNCEQSLSAGIPLPRINDWQEPTYLEIRKPLLSLYNMLLKPISDDLSSYQIIMFALPSVLDGIPMHALISSENKSVPRFLIQDYEVGYLGEDMLGDLISRDSQPIDPSSDRLAIFADPDGNLPGARDEASKLERFYFTSTKYIGRRASVSNFIKECDKASILHIAVHYKVDPTKFMLQLALDDKTDSYITVQELSSISNSHLQLVVLSACESAASTDPLQYGPSCAAEVFSLVGAKSVLGGIWKVPDASTSQLMGDFYRTLSRGRTRTGSLQSAQLAMIDDKTYAHPFYWACFALYGNPW